jgi:hypothetical protein
LIFEFVVEIKNRRLRVSCYVGLPHGQHKKTLLSDFSVGSVREWYVSVDKQKATDRQTDPTVIPWDVLSIGGFYMLGFCQLALHTNFKARPASTT